MKKGIYVVLGVAAIVLAGCASKEVKRAECSFPDAPSVAAPLWVCDAPVEGVAVSAVGSAQKSAAGSDFMKTMAASAARDRLARQMQVYVSNMVKRYAETTGAADTETVDMVNTSVSKQVTKATLQGSKIYRTTVSPTGTMYVIVGMDENLAKQQAKQVLNTSMKNDQAMWQQFKAKQTQDELAAEITKLQ